MWLFELCTSAPCSLNLSHAPGEEAMIPKVVKMVGVWEERRVFGSGRAIKARSRLGTT